MSPFSDKSLSLTVEDDASEKRGEGTSLSYGVFDAFIAEIQVQANEHCSPCLRREDYKLCSSTFFSITVT